MKKPCGACAYISAKSQVIRKKSAMRRRTKLEIEAIYFCRLKRCVIGKDQLFFGSTGCRDWKIWRNGK